MKLTFCSKEIILHEVTGYPSCLIKVYPYERVFTTWWAHRKSTVQHIVNINDDMDRRIEAYAFSHECTTETVALHYEIDQQGGSRLRDTSYRLYSRDQNGVMDWDRCYGLDHKSFISADKHRTIIQPNYPDRTLVIVRVDHIFTVEE